MNPLDIRLLIVGPDYIYRKNIHEMLTALGFRQIREVLDATAAWECITEDTPSVVVAQWEMPEMSGMALLKLIRRSTEQTDLPVILWTREIAKADVIKAGESGVSGIIVDPISMERLEGMINLLLEFELSPSNRKAKAHLAKGDLLMEDERYEDALREYGKVLDVLESAEVYYNIGYIKTAKGEYDEALAAFRKATQINQMFAKAYKAMAEVYLKMGNRNMAEKYLQMAGEIFLERQMHENAESIFKEILSINPNTINVYNSLGILYRRQNRIQEAIDLYEKAVKIDPHDENIYFNLGRAYLDLNNPEMARKCFSKALKINPNLDMARGMLKAIDTSSGSS